MENTENVNKEQTDNDENKSQIQEQVKEIPKKLYSRTKTFFSDFIKFINKGNIVNLAVALVIGTAFTKIVNSLVNDIIMPLFSMIFGETSLGDMAWVISDSIQISWGKFLLAIVEFVIIAFCIFFTLRICINSQKQLNRISKKQLKLLKKKGELPPVAPEPAPVAIESTEDILKDIRKLLMERNSPEENKNKEIDT